MFSRQSLVFTVFTAATALPVASLAAATVATLHSFAAGLDGEMPLDPLVYRNGAVYGTTELGGSFGGGTVFAVDVTSGNETVLHNFGSGPEGDVPTGGLVYRKGVLFGATNAGGPVGGGNVFAITASNGFEKTVNGFSGSNPQGTLISFGGHFYGTTTNGGSVGYGTVFELDPVTATQTILHSFGGGNDGAYPYAGVTYHAGRLYGVTMGDQGISPATVFSYDLSTGRQTVLHVFQGGTSDGDIPTGRLLYHNGVLYGTTLQGGARGEGTVFSIDLATRKETILYSFTGSGQGSDQNDGFNPGAGLIYSNGLLYGTTIYGGLSNGIVFTIDPVTGEENVAYRFNTTNDPANPYGELIEQNGAFYGTSYAGGDFGHGTVFKLTP